MLRLFNVSNEKTFFGKRINITFGNKLPIGGLHGDHADTQIFCKAALGGQTASRRENAR